MRSSSSTGALWRGGRRRWGGDTRLEKLPVEKMPAPRPEEARRAALEPQPEARVPAHRGPRDASLQRQGLGAALPKIPGSPHPSAPKGLPRGPGAPAGPLEAEGSGWGLRAASFASAAVRRALPFRGSPSAMDEPLAPGGPAAAAPPGARAGGRASATSSSSTTAAAGATSTASAATSAAAEPAAAPGAPTAPAAAAPPAGAAAPAAAAGGEEPERDGEAEPERGGEAGGVDRTRMEIQGALFAAAESGELVSLLQGAGAPDTGGALQGAAAVPDSSAAEGGAGIAADARELARAAVLRSFQQERDAGLTPTSAAVAAIRRCRSMSAAATREARVAQPAA